MGAVAGGMLAAESPTQTLPRPAGNGVGPGEGLQVARLDAAHWYSTKSRRRASRRAARS